MHKNEMRRFSGKEIIAALMGSTLFCLLWIYVYALVLNIPILDPKIATKMVQEGFIDTTYLALANGAIIMLQNALVSFICAIPITLIYAVAKVERNFGFSLFTAVVFAVSAYLTGTWLFYVPMHLGVLSGLFIIMIVIVVTHMLAYKISLKTHSLFGGKNA